MDFITQLQNISPIYLACFILIMSLMFTVAWFFDSKFHGKIFQHDITDKELQTHRLILIPSVLMEISLIATYWLGAMMLPLFLAFYLVRTVQEFIDELHFHTTRCTFFESILHLVMWITVHAKTFAFFIWAFLLQYQGLAELPSLFYVLFLILTLLQGYIATVEWNRKTS